MKFIEWMVQPKVFWKLCLAAMALVVVVTYTGRVISNNLREPAIMEIENTQSLKAKGAVIQTSLGEIEISYRHPNSKGAEIFSFLSQREVYDGTRIERVVNDLLMEMGGDRERALPQFSFPDELETKSQMSRGVVVFANHGQNTNGSQVFILSQDAPFLDGDYTVLGDVVRGMEVVDTIIAQPVGLTGLPKRDIWIWKIEIVEEQ